MILSNILLYFFVFKIIVDIAENVEPSRRVGYNNLLLFKFVINNEDGERVQVLAWNDQLARAGAIIKNKMEKIYMYTDTDAFTVLT